MEEDYDPKQVPLSRVMSDRSLEEDRPGFFDLSTEDDLVHRFSDFTQEPPSPTQSPCENCYLTPKYAASRSPNPVVTVTDWTDPLRAQSRDTDDVESLLTSARSSVTDLHEDMEFSLGDRWNSPIPMTDQSKGKGDSSNSAMEQNLEYEGKPPMMLSMQALQQASSESSKNRTIWQRILDYLRSTFIDQMTPSGFRSYMRCLGGFLIVSILLIVPATARWIGPVDVLTCSGLIFFPPNKTLGAQLEASVLGVLFILLTGVYNYAGLACLVAYNTSADPKAMCCCANHTLLRFVQQYEGNRAELLHCLGN